MDGSAGDLLYVLQHLCHGAVEHANDSVANHVCSLQHSYKGVNLGGLLAQAGETNGPYQVRGFRLPLLNCNIEKLAVEQERLTRQSLAIVSHLKWLLSTYLQAEEVQTDPAAQ